jgi:hypothetical protein
MNLHHECEETCPTCHCCDVHSNLPAYGKVCSCEARGLAGSDEPDNMCACHAEGRGRYDNEHGTH